MYTFIIYSVINGYALCLSGLSYGTVTLCFLLTVLDLRTPVRALLVYNAINNAQLKLVFPVIMLLLVLGAKLLFDVKCSIESDTQTPLSWCL